MDEIYTGETVFCSNQNLSVRMTQMFELEICYSNNATRAEFLLTNLSSTDMENLSKMFAKAANELIKLEELCRQTEEKK